jgi:RNA polymerase sigma-70 factor, ECF subfamily
VIDVDTEQRLLAGLRSAAAASRDRAMQDLHDCLGRQLFHVCLRVACDATDAEDALQEAYLDVLRGVGAFRGESRLSTWLFQIAVRAALRTRHRRRRRPLADLGDHEPGGGADPVAAAIEREHATALLAAIAELPAAQRSVLGLASLQGMSNADVAAVLGIPVGTVGSRLFEAKQRLRAVLGQRG